MISPEFEGRLVAYFVVGALGILLWDILNNVKDDYRLLFHHRIKFPTIVYCISRLSVFCYIFPATIFWTAPGIPCESFQSAYVAGIVANLTATPFLAYLRVCAVWHWNRYIVVFFGLSWLAVVGSGFPLVRGFKPIQVGVVFCSEIIVVSARVVEAPFITSLFNHTAVFLAITYGICKNTIGKGLGFRDSIRLILGKGLPTFSKALLHNSQVSYLIILIVIVAAMAWCYVWTAIQPTSGFRLALVPPYVALTNIMICRVFRNTKLGLYNQATLPSSGAEMRTPVGVISWNSRHIPDTHSDTGIPLQVVVSQNVERKSDYPPLSTSKQVDVLDFGMA